MSSQSDSEEVETFLRRLESQLNQMPQEDRMSVHQELHQHLDALVRAYEKQGIPREAAITAAMRQFGEPSQLGRRLFREWQLDRIKRRVADFKATAGACALFLTIFSVNCWLLHLPLLNLGHSVWIDYGVIYGLTPLLAGSVIGHCFPRSAVLSSVHAGLALTGLLALVTLPSALQSADPFFGVQQVLMEIARLAICWPVLGGLAAFLGARRRGGFSHLRFSGLRLEK